MSSTIEDPNTSGLLDRLIGILENPEHYLLPLLQAVPETTVESKETTIQSEFNAARKKTLQDLLNVARVLFHDIDLLGEQYFQCKNEQQRRRRTPKHQDSRDPYDNTLSGMSELFLPPDMELTNANLPEMLYGQVDLQNSALKKLVRKATKKLGKNVLDIRVLDTSLMGDNDKNGSGDDQDEKSNSSEEHANHSDDGGVTRRIQERMNRAMEDMENEDDGQDLSVAEKPPQKLESDLYDPVAEDLKDGFFDLHEMEDFADEEENLLPEEAFGQPREEQNSRTKTSMSIHQRNRERRLEGDDEESLQDAEDDTDDENFEHVENIKRRQYRDQEDIDALYSLYEGLGSEDEAVGAATMTAAEFFGKPNTKYMERYKKMHRNSDSTRPLLEEHPDNDSWGEYDFEKEDESGWGSQHGDAADLDVVAEKKDTDHQERQLHTQHKEHTTESKSSSKGDKTGRSKEEAKLRRQTEELEYELLAEKPWQMTGESKGSSRPVNSLLESTPEFEMAGKQAPVITVEYTMDLEDVIKKRILADDWDDVVPRELPDVAWHKKRGEAPEVSQEKSKLSLGELYEREFLKKTTGYDKDNVEKMTQEEKAKEEMRTLFANLCSKLDALSNYHFAPRPIAEEADVKPMTTPAIAMEEVLPLHVSDARGAAPQEVFASKRGRDGVLQADSEIGPSDRKRRRQLKKASRRKARREKQADEKLISRLQPGLGLNNPYEKRKAQEELRMARAQGKVSQGEQDNDARVGTSSTFFQRMQAEVLDSVGKGSNQQEPTLKSKSSAFKL
jgi:U3 small nucleolar RNA-associated protein MPP10